MPTISVISGIALQGPDGQGEEDGRSQHIEGEEPEIQDAPIVLVGEVMVEADEVEVVIDPAGKVQTVR
jgi:hypothetical protein